MAKIRIFVMVGSRIIYPIVMRFFLNRREHHGASIRYKFDPLKIIIFNIFNTFQNVKIYTIKYVETFTRAKYQLLVFECKLTNKYLYE